jgi:integral membrane protein (TIGR01906 family)
MPRPLRIAMVGVLALLVTPVLVLNAMRAALTDPYVRFESSRMAPVRGLTEGERTRLALAGLHAVQPGGPGLSVLRAARLPSGRPAFRQKELKHMEDVKTWISRLYAFHFAAGGVLAAALAVLSVRRGTRSLARRTLQLGAGLTLALAACVLLLVAVSYHTFESGFHGLFFTGESWRFAESDTLRKVYPDRFWTETAIALGAAAVTQAALLLTVVWATRRRPREQS